MFYPHELPYKKQERCGFTPPEKLRWLYIDFNSFFASCEQQAHPHLRGKPLAVVPVLSDATCAIAASYEAKAYGIKTGTAIWEAKRKCPSLHLALASHRLYVEIHEKIIRTIEQHCLPVAAVCSIDEIACRLEGPEQLADGAYALASHIKSMLALHVGPFITCSIGLSSNRFLAKVACDMQKPDGLTCLAPHLLPDALLRLHPTDLPGISHNMYARLHHAGITTMRDLWDLPPKHLRRAFGSILGERFWMQLHGYDTPSIETKRSSIGHSRVLDPAHRPLLHAWPVARHLLLKAATRLRGEHFAAGILVFSARIEQGPRFHNAMRFLHTGDSLVFLKALDTMWQHMLAHHRPHALKKISVVLGNLIPEGDVTLDLFAQKRDIRTHEKLSHAVDAVQGRFGKNAISYGWKGPSLDNFGTKIAFTRVPRMDEFNHE